MDDMRRGLDFQKATDALSRAAVKAVHGTREERSGRFTRRSDERRDERTKGHSSRPAPGPTRKE